MLTLHTGAETIQWRKLFKGGNYVRKYGIYYEIFKNKLLYSFTVDLQFSLSEPYKKIVVKFRSDCKIRHRELKTIEDLLNNKKTQYIWTKYDKICHGVIAAALFTSTERFKLHALTQEGIVTETN